MLVESTDNEKMWTVWPLGLLVIGFWFIEIMMVHPVWSQFGSAEPCAPELDMWVCHSLLGVAHRSSVLMSGWARRGGVWLSYNNECNNETISQCFVTHKRTHVCMLIHRNIHRHKHVSRKWKWYTAICQHLVLVLPMTACQQKCA